MNSKAREIAKQIADGCPLPTVIWEFDKGAGNTYKFTPEIITGVSELAGASLGKVLRKRHPDLLPEGIEIRLRPDSEHTGARFDAVVEKYKGGPYNPNYYIAGFSLSRVPGCCGYVLSTSSHVGDSYRGMGIATALQPVKELLAKELGYQMMLCTVRLDNVAELRVLEKAGWSKMPLLDTESHVEGKRVAMFFKRLGEDENTVPADDDSSDDIAGNWV